MGRKSGGGGDAGGGRNGKRENVEFTRVVPRFLIGLVPDGDMRRACESDEDDGERAAIAAAPKTEAEVDASREPEVELAELRAAGFRVDGDCDGGRDDAGRDDFEANDGKEQDDYAVEGEGGGSGDTEHDVAVDDDSGNEPVLAALAARGTKRERSVAGKQGSRPAEQKRNKSEKTCRSFDVRNTSILSFGNEFGSGDDDDDDT
jgi:hypothetical protein